MSRSGGINIGINAKKIDFGALDLLNMFELHNWSIVVNDNICYLPLNDDDKFDWTYVSKKEKEFVYTQIIQKELDNEIIGIMLLNDKFDTGFYLLIFPEFEKLSLDLYFNRKIIANSDITDYTWYLSQLCPILINAGFSLEYIECVDA